MNYICFFFLMSILSSCSQYSSEEKEYNDFVNCQAEYILKNHSFKLYSFGGFNSEGVKGYSFSFISNEKVDENVARKLIVNLVEDVVANGNVCLNALGKSSKQRDQYEIAIVFFDKDTGVFYTINQSLAKVSYSDEYIRFVKNESDSSPLETIARESYQEAYEKVFGKQLDKDSM